jgi:hypothetical protein
MVMVFTNPSLLDAIMADSANLIFRADDGTWLPGVLIAAKFNNEVAGLPEFTCPPLSVGRDVMATKIVLPSEIIAIPNDRLYSAMTQLLAFQTFDLADPVICGEIEALLMAGGCTQSVANIKAAALPQPCTYAEFLWGRGQYVSWHDVQILLNEGISSVTISPIGLDAVAGFVSVDIGVSA